MKRIMISVVIASISLPSLAQEWFNETEYQSKKISVGIELFNSNNDFNSEASGQSVSVRDDSKGLALQLSIKTGSTNTVSTFIEYRNEGFDKGIYSNSSDTLHYFNLGLLKEFPIANNWSPYIKGALGYGFMDIGSIDDLNITNVFGGKVGAGLGYYPTSSVKIHAGVDYQYRSWSSVEANNIEYDIDESSFVFGLGASYLF